MKTTAKRIGRIGRMMVGMAMVMLLPAGVGAQGLDGGSYGQSSELVQAIEALPSLRAAKQVAEQAADNFDYAPLRLEEPKEVAYDTAYTADGRMMRRPKLTESQTSSMFRLHTIGRKLWEIAADGVDNDPDGSATSQAGVILCIGWLKLSVHTARGVDKTGYSDWEPVRRVKVHTQLYTTIGCPLPAYGWSDNNTAVWCYHDMEKTNTWRDEVQESPVAYMNEVYWASRTSAGLRVVVETDDVDPIPGGGWNVSLNDIDGVIAKENVATCLPATLNIAYVDGPATIGDMFRYPGTGPEDVLLRTYGMIPVEQYNRNWFSGITDATPISALNHSQGIDLGVTGVGRFYTGSTTIHLNFINIPLRKEWIRGLPASVVYNGGRQTPSISMVNNGAALKEYSDYNVEYSNNTNVGTGWVVVTGLGRYTGTITEIFEITPKPLAADFIADIAEQTYTGSPLTPAVTVKDSALTLTAGRDYSVAYLNNTNAGAATIRITGIGNYGGTIDRPFTIAPKPLPALPSVAQQSYTGNAFTPTITLTDDDRTLGEGTDYTLVYSDNIDAGTATITATGMGNYIGTQTTTFTIAPHPLTDGVDIKAATPSERVYNGAAQEFEVLTLAYGSNVLTATKDYTVAYSNNIDVGTAQVVISGTGNYTGTLSTTFGITRRSLGGCTLGTTGSYVYNGEALTPTISVTDGSRTLTLDKDYTYAVENNVSAGNANITATGIGNYTDKLYGSFTIAPKPLANGSVHFTGDSAFVYTGEAFRPAFAVMDGGKELVAYEHYSYDYKDNVLPGTATLTVTGAGNYGGTQTLTFVISRRSIEESWLRMTEKSYTANGAPVAPSFVLVDYANQRTLKQATDYTVVYNNNVTPGVATMVIEGMGAYCGTITCTYTILEAPAPPPNPYSGDSVEEVEPEPEPGALDIASEQISVSVGGTLYNEIIRVKNNVDGTVYEEGVDWELTWIVPGTPVLLQLTGKGALTGERYVWTAWVVADGGTEAVTASASSLRAVSQGSTLVVEGLQAGKAFALYTIEGRKTFSGVAPASGTYILSGAAEGMYILEQSGQRVRVYHRGR